MRNRITLTLGAVAATSALVTATAFAHETVKSTSPGKGKTASTSITSASVTFNAQIRSGSMKVTGPGGKVVSSGKGGRDPRNVKRVKVPLKSGLKAGSYKATWSITAGDGHAETGTFTFKLK